MNMCTLRKQKRVRGRRDKERMRNLVICILLGKENVFLMIMKAIMIRIRPHFISLR